MWQQNQEEGILEVEDIPGPEGQIGDDLENKGQSGPSDGKKTLTIVKCLQQTLGTTLEFFVQKNSMLETAKIFHRTLKFSDRGPEI